MLRPSRLALPPADESTGTAAMPTLFSQLSKICLIGGLLVARCWAVAMAAAMRKLETGQEDAPVLAVRAAAAETRALEETVDGIGRSEALPGGLVTLTPALQGHVEAIAANLGDSVHRGDLIVELDATIAKADVAERQANRDTLKAALRSAAGRSAARGSPGFGNRRRASQGGGRPVEGGSRSIATAVRTQGSFGGSDCTRPSRCSCRRNCNSNRPRRNCELLLAGPRPEAVEEGKARLAAAEEALALARAHLALHSIRSPIDGVLDSLTCHPGQTVAAGTAIGEIVDTPAAQRRGLVAAASRRPESAWARPCGWRSGARRPQPATAEPATAEDRSRPPEQPTGRPTPRDDRR